MNLLFITQVYYPDSVSVSQHVTDMAEYCVLNGHNVTVYTSIYPYEEKGQIYPVYEIHNGVKIKRFKQTRFGKSNSFFRILDFLSFNINIFINLLLLRKKNFDCIIGTTVPPFLSFIGVIISKLKHIPFFYWVMDLQPELSIASNLIKKSSIAAKFFTLIGNVSIKYSDKIISLDRFMTAYLEKRGADSFKIHTIPVWPVLEDIYQGERLVNPFRIANNFGDKIVIMYSGNHAFVHPLDTLLNVAKELKNDERFLFVFIGGGVRKKDVSIYKEKNELSNIIQLPFQPRSNIHNSLGASDFQVVILGESQVGFTHPNKIYGAMCIGKPIVYIGPSKSHVSDIFIDLPGNISVQHNEVNKLVDEIVNLANKTLPEIEKIGTRNLIYSKKNFAPNTIKKQMLEAILSPK
jgi:colanic acid biosynthesis glycosyl transferase WcaI